MCAYAFVRVRVNAFLVSQYDVGKAGGYIEQAKHVGQQLVHSHPAIHQDGEDLLVVETGRLELLGQRVQVLDQHGAHHADHLVHHLIAYDRHAVSDD